MLSTAKALGEDDVMTDVELDSEGRSAFEGEITGAGGRDGAAGLLKTATGSKPPRHEVEATIRMAACVRALAALQTDVFLEPCMLAF